MKKASVLSVAVIALFAFIALPNAVYAGPDCGAKKTTAQEASSKSACSGSTDATKAAAKTVGADCGSKATTATAKTVGADCGSKATAQLAGADCSAACAGIAGKCEKVSMNISGMTCTGCEDGIKTALTKMDGVIAVQSISHKDGSATVCFDPNKIKADAVTTAISNKGYGVKLMPAVATTASAQTKQVDASGCDAATKAACGAACPSAAKKTAATAVDPAKGSK